MRGESQACTFITAHRKHGSLDVDWELVLRLNQTVVFYMGLSVIDELVEGLLQRGMSSETPFYVVSNATMKEQVVVGSTLGDVQKRLGEVSMPSPALLIMGPSISRDSCYHLSTDFAAGLSL